MIKRYLPLLLLVIGFLFLTSSAFSQVQSLQNGLLETHSTVQKVKDNNDVQVNAQFFLNLFIDISALILIIVLIYYPNNHQKENIFTFFMFNLMIFMLTFLLDKIQISIGAAFGLFAVFSMLRYRTEGITMKDMTYLFIFIAVGLISAVNLIFYELIIINAVIILFTFILDGNYFFKNEHSKLVEYENIDLIIPENYDSLMNDLRKRTGLNIYRIHIEKISFLRDTAFIKIFYTENKSNK